MATPLRRAEDVSDEIKTRIAAVRLTNGAETDIGRQVWSGRRKIDDSMIPCSVLIEGDDIADREVRGTLYDIDQRYVWMAYLECNPDDPNAAAHKALRDMKRALFVTAGRPDETWGRRVREVRYIGRDIGARADGAAFVLAIIEFAVSYVEDAAAP